MVEQFVPKLRLLKTLWGVEGADDPTKWESLFNRIKSEGFSIIETKQLFFQQPGFTDALKAAGLDLVAQVHTSHTEQYRYCGSIDVKDHVDSLRILVNNAKEAGAIYVNSHSGCDSWSIQQAREYLVQALEIEKEAGIPILHETHRRRIFWNPFNFRDILKGQENLKDIKVNLDISHWVLCLERIFATEHSLHENGPVDDWWPEVLEMLKARTNMIHARIGYQEGPQVPDPSAPEYSKEQEAHMYYWEEVIKGQIENKKVSFVEPEHGPWPYQQSIPGTNMSPNHDIWKSNLYVAKLVSDRFPQIVESMDKK